MPLTRSPKTKFLVRPFVNLDPRGHSDVIYRFNLTGFQYKNTSMHFTAHLPTIGLLVILAACGRQPQAVTPPYALATDMRHTMELIIDPAADVIWDSAGTIITAAGEDDRAPTTPDDWARVEAAAAVLAESGNLLMMPGRSAGPDWNEHASDLISAGKQAMVAAEQQDAGALFDVGGRIYQACLACHSQYLVDDGAQ